MGAKSGRRADRGTRHSTVVHKPVGSLPVPQVIARHLGATVVRESKGFSLGELEGSAIPWDSAKRWGLSLDQRRKSVLDRNVDSLKAWYSRAKKEEKGEEAKRIEEELGRVAKGVEKEVKKGAVKAKKEVAKAKKEVKKVEEKVENEVRKVKKKQARKKAGEASDEKDE